MPSFHRLLTNPDMDMNDFNINQCLYYPFYFYNLYVFFSVYFATVNTQLCGAPLVPRGSVYPLEPLYELGATVTIECNPQYSFPDETIEIITICQGRNLWNPPAPPCMCKYKFNSEIFTNYF